MPSCVSTSKPIIIYKLIEFALFKEHVSYLPCALGEEVKIGIVALPFLKIAGLSANTPSSYSKLSLFILQGASLFFTSSISVAMSDSRLMISS